LVSHAKLGLLVEKVAALGEAVLMELVQKLYVMHHGYDNTSKEGNKELV